MAKIPKYGGIPGCISAVPEIDVYPMSNDNDYLMLGCDGIFDQLTNEQIRQVIINESIN